MVRLRALHTDELNLLSAEEHARLADIPHALRARQFAAARLLLRQILGQVLDQDPGSVPLRNTPKGPTLEGWHLSVSHSEQWVAAACGLEPLGVDIEAQRPTEEAMQRVCARPELLRLTPEHYIATWTRKEALAKALGRAMGGWLRDWDVRGNAAVDWQWETRMVGRAVCSLATTRGRAAQWLFYE